MPTAGQWTKFLVAAGGFLGTGIFTVTKLMPSDEEVINSLSPELRARYYKEKEIRHRAQQIMEQKIKEQQDKPAWLQGSQVMREFERKITQQARDEIEREHKTQAQSQERVELAELAKKEKRM